MREMRETLRATFDRVFRLENRRRALRRGLLERIAGFHSRILRNVRQITVYLPPGYERAEWRYPVLYMHDGQNLFEPQRAFIPGQHWRLIEAVDEAIGRRDAQPMIIVGIDHADRSRIDEYTPTRDPSRLAGGRADDYGRMLLEELKPLVDARYRTVAEDSAIGGSSLGGLLSLYLGLKHPDVFRRLAILSPSVWWDGRAVLQVVDRFAGRRPRIWLDVGGREGGDGLRDVRVLHERLLRKGWSDADLKYFEDRRGDHSERAWARRVGGALEFLFPPV